MANRLQTLDEISEDNVRFYFDSVRKDQIDHVKLNQRATDLLVIRAKLGRLPDKNYEQAIRSITSLLASYQDAHLLAQEKEDKDKDQQTAQSLVKGVLRK